MHVPLATSLKHASSYSRCCVVVDMLVDAGIGSTLKTDMGNRLDDWLSEDDNLNGSQNDYKWR